MKSPRESLKGVVSAACISGVLPLASARFTLAPWSNSRVATGKWL